MTGTKSAAGFTLIELLIAVAIVGILATVAYPSYQESVRKSHRADGMALVNRIMQAQERYFVTNMTYTEDLTDLGFTTADDVLSEEGFYQANAAACGGDITVCVAIVATALGSQAVDGDLSLNSQGTKTGNW
jgi:type IV pilus assembly protein PilE